VGGYFGRMPPPWLEIHPPVLRLFLLGPIVFDPDGEKMRNQLNRFKNGLLVVFTWWEGCQRGRKFWRRAWLVFFFSWTQKNFTRLTFSTVSLLF
jgi:hypothetical protein